MMELECAIKLFALRIRSPKWTTVSMTRNAQEKELLVGPVSSTNVRTKLFFGMRPHLVTRIQKLIGAKCGPKSQDGVERNRISIGNKSSSTANMKDRIHLNALKPFMEHLIRRMHWNGDFLLKLGFGTNHGSPFSEYHLQPHPGFSLFTF